MKEHKRNEDTKAERVLGLVNFQTEGVERKHLKNNEQSITVTGA